MSSIDLSLQTHRRLNPLTGEWILVSPQRTARPWQGQIEAPAADLVAPYDASCYMCPGNARASGDRNPEYTSTFAFTNDFPALVPLPLAHGTGIAVGVEAGIADRGAVIRSEPESGMCRVICFSPRHDLTLSKLTRAEIRLVVDLWIEERATLAARNDIRYVQIFENRGAMMGASNPHPHGQIWASSSVPAEVAKEHARQRAHYEETGRDLLGDYLDLEIAEGTRVVCTNASFVTVVPFWAVWPFETMILPRRRVPTIDQLSSGERDALADILKRTLSRCDRLFDTTCPYSMGFHECPADPSAHDGWRWHAHIYPPLLRSATVRKFMVGYELLASPQRDITAEVAAERLRAIDEL